MKAFQRWSAVVFTILWVVGCATTPPPPPSVDVTGAWTGTFEGQALGIRQSGAVEAAFAQTGAEGTGRMRFAYGVGDTFHPVRIAVAGNRVTAEHAEGAHHLTVVLFVDGDTMSGTITSSGAPVKVTLKRVR